MNIKGILQKATVAMLQKIFRRKHALRPTILTVTYVHIPPTGGRSLLRRWQTRMREVAWWMTTCYYTTWKYSHSSRANYTLLEMLHVFSLQGAAELSVAVTSRCCLVPVQSTPPDRAKHAHPALSGSSLGLPCVHKLRRYFSNICDKHRSKSIRTS
jgi:hypothetical protein